MPTLYSMIRIENKIKLNEDFNQTEEFVKGVRGYHKQEIRNGKQIGHAIEQILTLLWERHYWIQSPIKYTFQSTISFVFWSKSQTKIWLNYLFLELECNKRWDYKIVSGPMLEIVER